MNIAPTRIIARILRHSMPGVGVWHSPDAHRVIVRQWLRAGRYGFRKINSMNTIPLVSTSLGSVSGVSPRIATKVD